MTWREVITVRSEAIKVGVVNSAVASIRSQAETEVGVRVMEGGYAGVASAVGQANLDALTVRAREALVFKIPYDVEPERGRELACNHAGDSRSEDELVRLTEEVLAGLKSNHPDLVFSHGVEQKRLQWDITSDHGLDLSYRRDTTSLVFVVKEKGSGNIIDTFVAVETGAVSTEEVLRIFDAHLSAFKRRGEHGAGRQRVIFPGLNSMAGESLIRMFRTDLVGRTYAQGASFFDGQVGDGRAHLSPIFTLSEVRNPSAARVCPFDMEGVVRDPLDLPVVREGRLVSLATSKRDAKRYGLTPSGTAIGGAGQLPTSGFGHLAAAPTAERLADLVGPEGGILVWFVAGGDCTRAGDIALPAQVLLAVDGTGAVTGRLPGATLTGNVRDVFGQGFVGSTVERSDPLSEEGFFVTHMSVVR